MQIQFPASITVIDGIISNFTVTVTATNGNLSLLRVEDPASAFQTLDFTQSGGPVVTNTPGATNLTATLAVLYDSTNSTQFILAAQDNFGLVVTQVVDVTSLAPLSTVLYAQPTNEIAFAGSNVLFSVGSLGSSLAYQWYHEGVRNLLDSSHVSGATGPVLALTNVSDSDNGKYFVTVGNLEGSVTSVVALLVVLDPAPARQTHTYWYERAATNNWNQSGPPGNWFDAASLKGTAYFPNGSNYNVVPGRTGRLAGQS